MIVRFVEASNSFNWGKFVLMRFDPDEMDTRSALPGHEDARLLQGRRWAWRETFVTDLQTGEGAAFSLAGSAMNAGFDLEKHRIWVCPMFEPMLAWLYEDGRWADGQGDLGAVPSYLDVVAPSSMGGYRRGGPG